MKKIVCILAALSAVSQAAVVPQQSRVIFHPGNVRIPLLLVNNGEVPVLIQTWVDLGTPNKKPGGKSFPFVALPAVFTLNKGEKKEITLIRSDLSADLPADRESLYWLNIYEISSVKKNTARLKQNKVSLAMNTQLKIINRPFTDKDDFRRRTQRMVFRSQLAEGEVVITAVNQTPYYFTPGQMSITVGPQQYQVYLDSDKDVAPFSDKTFSLKTHLGSLPAGKASLHFTAIDDQGALQSFTYDLSRQ